MTSDEFAREMKRADVALGKLRTRLADDDLSDEIDVVIVGSYGMVSVPLDPALDATNLAKRVVSLPAAEWKTITDDTSVTALEGALGLFQALPDKTNQVCIIY